MSEPDFQPAGPLGVHAARGTASALVSQVAKFAIYFGVGIALARLLSPEDFGVFAIALAVTGFLDFAKDAGMVVPVIQAETLSAEQLDTLFWFNVGIGVAITAVTAAAAPVVAQVYGDTRLVAITCVLALVFLAGGVSTQHVALLRRQMRFTALAWCEVIALAISAALAIMAALRGAHYWSLVVFHLGREVLQTVIVVALTRWVPAWPRRRAPVGALMRFGGLMMVFDIIGYFNLKFDNLVVGWFLGPAALGLYDKAYQFLLIPVNQINAPLSTVVHSALSRLQREPARYRAYLSRALLLGTGLGLPVIAFAYANAHALMRTLFGEPWVPAAPIFQAIAPAAACMVITVCVGWIFLSLGRAKRQLPWLVFTTVVSIIGFIVGARWGAVGVAAALSITRVALLVPTLWFTCHSTPVSWTDVVATTARPVAASALALVASLGMDVVFAQSQWTLLRNGVVFAVVYQLAWVAMPGGLTLVRENLLLARTLYRNP